MAVGSALNVPSYNASAFNGAVGLSPPPVLFPSPRRPATQRIPFRRGVSMRGYWIGPAPGTSFAGSTNAAKLVGGFNTTPFNTIAFNTNNTVTPPTWRSTGNGAALNRVSPNGTSRFNLAPAIVALTGAQRPVTRTIPFRRGKSSIGRYALNGPPTGNILMTAPWLLTSNYVSGLYNLNQFSLSLWFRFNGSVPPVGTTLINGYYNFVEVSVAYTGSITVLLGSANGNFSATAGVSPGVTYHVVLTWDSGSGPNTGGTPRQCFYLNGVLQSTGSVAYPMQNRNSTAFVSMGSSSAFSSGGSVSMSEFCMWTSHVLSSTEVSALRNRTTTPMGVSVPASFYYSLGANVYGGSASTTDFGLANYGTVGSPAGNTLTWTRTGSGNAIYSSEILSYSYPAKVADAYISKSGQQLFLFLAQTASGGTIVNNAGTYEQSVLSVQVTSQGSGYTNPTASIAASPAGSNASLGKPIVSNGKIVGIPVLSGGTNYYSVSPPTITISDPTGTGAVASVTLGSTLNPVGLVNSVPTILKNGSPVTPALLLTGWLTNSGVGVTTAGETVTISGGGGSGAAATATVVTVDGKTSVVGYTVTNGGSGYTSAPSVTYTSTGYAVAASGTAVVSGGVVTSIIGPGGSGYTSPTITLTGGGGTGAIAAALFPSSALTGILVTNGGSGYTSGTTAYLEGNTNGNVATATTFIVGGVVTNINLGNAGSGYWTTPPTLLIVGGGGSGATATCNLSNGAIYSVTLTNGGSGYTSPPTVLFTGSGNPYALTCTVTGGAVTAIALSGTPGSFTHLPTVWIIGSGTGATAQPTIAATYLTGVAMVNIGSGYTSAPTATVNDPTGSNASVTIQPVPVGTPYSLTAPWICIPLPSQAAATDVFTYSAPAGWAQTAGGYAAGSVTNAFVSNYTGLDEPAFHAIATAQVASGKTLMQIGANLTAPIADYFGDYSISANWIHKAGGPLYGSLTSNQPGDFPITYQNGNTGNYVFETSTNNLIDGKFVPIPAAPIAVFSGGGGTGAAASVTVVNGVVANASVTAGGSGYASAPTVAILGPGGQGATATAQISGGAVTGIHITNGGSGYSTGLWTVMWDETNPAKPNEYVLSDAAGNYNCTLVATTPGTLVNGVLTGVSNTYQFTYKSANPSQWKGILNVALSNSSYANGATVTNTTQNPWIFSPYATSFDRTATNVDQLMLNYLTSSVGTPAACVRAMDSTTGYAGQSNVVDVTDRQMPSYFSWSDNSSPTNVSTPYSRTISIVEMRNYNFTTSPNIYVGANYPGTTAAPSGSPQPYMFTPTTMAFLGGIYGTFGNFGVEYVTSVNHGLKTGQFVTLSIPNGQSAFSVTVTNGTGTPITGISLGNYSGKPAYVTGPTTFVLTQYTSSINNTTGTPGGVNSIVGTVSTTNYTVSVSVPDYASTPVEVACNVAGSLPNTSFWLTIPHAASDALVTAYANLVLEYLPAGRKVYVEYSNEQWNTNQWEEYWGYSLAVLMTNGTLSNGIQGSLIRAAQVHQLVYNAFAAAGRGGEVVRFVSAQPVATGASVQFTQAQNSAVYSVLGLSGPIQIDAIGFSPYQMSPSDTVYVAAQASFAPAPYGSVAFGSTQPWTQQMVGDLMKHDQFYRQDATGSGTNGQTTGYYTQCAAAVAAYNAATGYNCKIVAYEGNFQNPVYGSASYKDSGFGLRLQQDIVNMPGYHDAMMALWGAAQAGGFALFNVFSLLNSLGTSNWTLAQWYGQQPGLGQNNLYGTQTGQGELQNNVSPALQAFQDWVAATNAAPTPIITSVVPYSGATGVSISTQVVATFSVPMDAPTLSITLNTLQGTLIPITLAYNSSVRQALITPIAPLVRGTTYAVHVISGSSIVGIPLRNTVSWSFRTKSDGSARWFPGLRRS